MNPTFRRMFLELDDSENRLQFLTADSAKIKELAEYDADPSCKPLFKLYKVRAIFVCCFVFVTSN
jgi:hypothetical protein